MEPRRGQAGAELVEFAITLLLWFATFLLIIDMSVVMYDKAAVTNAGRYAGRQSTVFWIDPANYSETTPIANMRLKESMIDTAAAYWASTVIAPGGGAVTVTTNPAGNRGSETSGGSTTWIGMADASVTVTLSYAHDFIGLTGALGVLNWTLGSEVTANSEARL
jgi:Flp pilus assembly protein TadG